MEHREKGWKQCRDVYQIMAFVFVKIKIIQQSPILFDVFSSLLTNEPILLGYLKRADFKFSSVQFKSRFIGLTILSNNKIATHARQQQTGDGRDKSLNGNSSTATCRLGSHWCLSAGSIPQTRNMRRDNA